MIHGISVIMTVRNDSEGLRETLESLRRQSRLPDEIVIVDGGEKDSLRHFVGGSTGSRPLIRVISAPGCNIARGRNIATAEAENDIIACIDAGCRAAPDWLAHLTRPFESDPATEFVAGLYRIAPKTLLEEVVGLATMRGQLDPVKPSSFNPSGRSMAYTRALWRRVQGWPEWLLFSEDTLFDHKVRIAGARWHLAEDAVVDWRPRTSLCSIARQFFLYGTGRGHTGIGKEDQLYNLRNASLTGLSLAMTWIHWAAIGISAILFGYFYAWTFHPKAVRIARATRRGAAYPLTLLVLWTVLFSSLAGFLMGKWQRYRDRERFERRHRDYMTLESAGA